MKTLTRLWLWLALVLTSLPLTSRADNSTWQEATPLSLGEELTYGHLTQRNMWWKVELESGKKYAITYYVKGKAGEYGYARLYLFDGENMEQEKTSERYSYYYTAERTGTHYLRSYYRLQLPSEDNCIELCVREEPTLDNDTRDKAQPVALGTQVVTSFGQHQELWYKVPLKGGKSYELDATKLRRHVTSLDGNLYHGEEDINLANYDFRTGIEYLNPREDMTYYLRLYTVWAPEGMATGSWTLREVTDNRAMNGALPFTLGTPLTIEATAPLYPSQRHWYSIEVEEGKCYEVDFTGNEEGVSLHLEGYDGKSNGATLKNERYLMLAPSTGRYYMAIERSTPLAARLTVREHPGDNRLYEYAEAVSPGQVVQTRHHTLGYDVQWYKVALEGDRCYELDLTKAGTRFTLQRKDPRGWFIVDATFEPLKKTLLYAARDTTLYLCSGVTGANGYTLDNPETDFTWSLYETEGDNRVYKHATPIALDQSITPDHTKAETLWYKAELQEGVLYEATWPEVEHSYSMYFYADPEQNQTLDGGYYSGGTGDKWRPTLQVEHTGTYYIKVMGEPTSTLTFTLKQVTDNRSCRYATPLTMGESIPFDDVSKHGHWFTVALEAGKFCEFDGTQKYDVSFALYTDCGVKTPLAQGQYEKMLYRPTASGTYLLHIRPTQPHMTVSPPWQFKTSLLETGDTRLCDHAVPLTTDEEVTVPLPAGHRTYWYAVTVQKDKWYRLTMKRCQNVSLYADCTDSAPLAMYSGTAMYHAEQDGTLYLEVYATNDATAAPALRFYEEKPDGHVCEHPLPLTLGETMVTPRPSDLDVENLWVASNETYYRFVAPETGRYRLYLYNFSIEPREQFYWYTFIYSDCQHMGSNPRNNIDQLAIAGAGHAAGDGQEAIFQAQEGDEYVVLVGSFGPSVALDLQWSITKVEGPKSHLSVHLVDATGTSLPMGEADLILYRQGAERIERQSVVPYTEEGFYQLPDVPYGTYLLHFRPTEDATEKYLPSWYRMGSTWQEATPIVIDGPTTTLYLPMLPLPVVHDEGVRIEGNVTSALTPEEGKDNLKGIGINLYILGTSQGVKGTTLYDATHTAHLTLARRAPSLEGWKLVAQTLTDENGDYAFEALPKGTYLLIADMPGYTSEGGQVIEAPEDASTYVAPEFLIDTDQQTVIATGIHSLSPDTEGSHGAQPRIYDLQGRRRHALQRGLNIVDKKKVIIK